MQAAEKNAKLQLISISQDLFYPFRFPNWLDRWLKMRKQLGLLMLFSACMHVRRQAKTKQFPKLNKINKTIKMFKFQACLSVAYMSPEYHTLVYGDKKSMSVEVVEKSWTSDEVEKEEKEVPLYGDKMEWRGEVFLTCGER